MKYKIEEIEAVDWVVFKGTPAQSEYDYHQVVTRKERDKIFIKSAAPEFPETYWTISMEEVINHTPIMKNSRAKLPS